MPDSEQSRTYSWFLIPLVLVVLAIIFNLAIQNQVAQLIFGSLLVLFLPGYALARLLFQNYQGIMGLEKFAIAVAFSLVISSLSILALQAAKIGINQTSETLALAGFTLIISAIAIGRSKTTKSTEQDIHQKMGIMIKTFTVLVFTIAILFPLTPFLINGGPVIGDSFVHLGIARDTIVSGTYSFGEYNTDWFLLNLLLTSYSLLTGLQGLPLTQLVPFLAGLSAVPLYCFSRRLGLPPFAALLVILFLNFNPLYSYLTFASASMRETSTFFLLNTALMISMILIAKRNSAPGIALLIIGAGIIFGHHYVGLVFMLFLAAVLFHSIIGKFGRASLNLKWVMIPIVGYVIIFLGWNLMRIPSLQGFEFVNSSDMLLLLSSYLALFVITRKKGVLSFVLPVLAVSMILFYVLGLRAELFALLQPIPAISIYEWRNYAVLAIVTVIGVMALRKNDHARALGIVAISLGIFPFVWDLSIQGFVLFTKSIHYFGIFIAISGGFYAYYLASKHRLVGTLVALGTISFMIYASSAGTALAINGLSTYTFGESSSIEALPPLDTSLEIKRDTRSNYILNYYQNIGEFDDEEKRGELWILSSKNLEQGYLLGYDWLPLKSIIGDDAALRMDKIADGDYLTILVRR